MTESNLGELTKELIEALSKRPVNVLIVRNLCRNNPGLIASAGLRLQAWSTLLLGPEYQQFNFKKDLLQEKLPDCQEQHVLEADVHRTRAESEYFCLQSTRELVHQILKKFCIDHSIQYKQGMNEVLAPFLSINSNEQKETYLVYFLFKAFVFRYLERFFCIDDSSFLYKSFRLFHLLLVYHDPQLALHLTDFDFTPEFYAPQWFLTLYARALPINHVLRLWDMMIAVDDPAFIFFIGLNLLIKQRNNFLLSDISNIPEIIANNISFKNEEEIDLTVKESLILYQITPRCLLRQLRLCCVSTVELTPQPSILLKNPALTPLNTNAAVNSSGSNSSSSGGVSPSLSAGMSSLSMKINVDDYDQLLSLQSVRNCFAITPQELIESMLTPSHLFIEKQQQLLLAEQQQSPSQSSSSILSSSHIPQQYVIIDIRSYDESTLSGGGILPRAIQLEPEFLNRPEALEVWLQHFDGTRGCNIVILDLPPPQWTGVNLWRRLLLGEGDGPKYSNLMDRYEMNNNLNDNKKRLDALIAHSRNQQNKKQQQQQQQQSSAASSTSNQQDNNNNADAPSISLREKSRDFLNKKLGLNLPNNNNNNNPAEFRDNQSKYYKDEENIIISDSNSPAMLLAMVLQRNSFPHVSILEGGFPALIDTLLTTKGKVEPIVVEHDNQKWIEFLRNTGRYQDKSSHNNNHSNSSSQGGGGSSAMMKLKRMISIPSDDENNDENHLHSPENIPLHMKKEKDLTALERYELALIVAERLGHNEMKRILTERITNLKQPKTKE